MNSLLETKSALLIASHRVSILEPCDKVLVMRDGRIIATGPYSDVRPLIESIAQEDATVRAETKSAGTPSEVRL